VSTAISERRGAVAAPTLDNPEKANAPAGGVLADLGRALDEAGADPETRAIVLTGAGRGFCSGAELGQRRSAPGPLAPGCAGEGRGEGKLA